MRRIKEIYDFIDNFAPFKSAMSFDNVGVLVDCENEVQNVLVCLDITDKAVEKAKEIKADLIISHHPVIFTPIKKLSAGDVVFKLVHNNISALCAHTNLDMGKGGVNDTLASTIGLTNIEPFAYYNEDVCALCGNINEKMQPVDFIRMVKSKLGCKSVKCTVGKKKVEKVAICSGAGSGILLSSENKADALVTGEVRHHEFILAEKLGITIIEAGHFETENIVVAELSKKLKEKFPDINFTNFDDPNVNSYNYF